MFLADLPWEQLFQYPGLFFLVLAVGGTITGVVIAIMYNWRKVREAEQKATIKQAMIEKGMTADEIVRVLKAGEDDGQNPFMVEAKTEMRHNLVEKLIEQGVSPEDIERLVKASGLAP